MHWRLLVWPMRRTRVSQCFSTWLNTEWSVIVANTAIYVSSSWAIRKLPRYQVVKFTDPNYGLRIYGQPACTQICIFRCKKKNGNKSWFIEIISLIVESSDVFYDNSLMGKGPLNDLIDTDCMVCGTTWIFIGYMLST